GTVHKSQGQIKAVEQIADVKIRGPVDHQDQCALLGMLALVDDRVSEAAHDLARHGQKQLAREVDEGFGLRIVGHGFPLAEYTAATAPFRLRSVRNLPCGRRTPGRPSWAEHPPSECRGEYLPPEDRLPHHISIHKSNTSRFA